METKTQKLYQTFMQSEEFLYTMQPGMLDDDSQEEEGDDDLLKLRTESAEQSKLGLIRQMTSNLS